MMKKASWMAAVGGSILMALGVANATTTTSGTFNVGVTLTPKCEIFNASGATTAIGDLTMSYTSFQASSSTGNTNFQIRCTNTQGYTLSLDNASVTDGTTGLAYTLHLGASSSYSATPNATLAGLSGNGLSGQTYYVHGTIAANQDGTATTGTPNNVRTLTISY